jgi:hypothetical protein
MHWVKGMCKSKRRHGAPWLLLSSATAEWVGPRNGQNLYYTAAGSRTPSIPPRHSSWIRISSPLLTATMDCCRESIQYNEASLFRKKEEVWENSNKGSEEGGQSDLSQCILAEVKTDRHRRVVAAPSWGEMILVAIMAELLEEYTAAVARAVERLLSSAAPRHILPRRVRFLVLRSLPFASPPPPPMASAPPPRPPPPPHAAVLTSWSAV